MGRLTMGRLCNRRGASNASVTFRNLCDDAWADANVVNVGRCIRLAVAADVGADSQYRGLLTVVSAPRTRMDEFPVHEDFERGIGAMFGDAEAPCVESARYRRCEWDGFLVGTMGKLIVSSTDAKNETGLIEGRADHLHDNACPLRKTLVDGCVE